MLSFVLLLACKDIFEVAGRSLRSQTSGRRDAVLRDRDLERLLHHISDCRTDPASCGDAADRMANFSANMTNQVLEDINETKMSFDNLLAEAAACNVDSTVDQAASFNAKVDTYMDCRAKQSAAGKLVALCDAHAGQLQSNQDLQCKSTILTGPISDVQDICKPSAQQPLGEWLESMAVQFQTKNQNFQKQQELCNDAQWALGNATDECNVHKDNSTAQNSSCDAELGELESFSCNWANGFTTQCSAYNLCYAGVLARYNQQKSEMSEKIERWTQTWTAAKKMECTSSAISSSDVVNATKMKECNSPNFTNISFIKVTIPAMPLKQKCPEPDVYPGSKLFRSKVYDGLPADVTVRLPTLCLSWMGACAPYSTFAGSAVFLKTLDGKFCHIGNSPAKEMYCDGTSKGLFAFTHTEGKAPCTGSAELSSVDSGELKCRFDPSAPAPEFIACGPAATGDPLAEIVISTNPLPTGRSGNVGLEFKGKTGQPSWHGGVSSNWQSWTTPGGNYNLGKVVDTVDSGGDSGFRGIRYNYGPLAQMAGKWDMTFSTRPWQKGGGDSSSWLTSMSTRGSTTYGSRSANSRLLSQGPAKMTCEPNHVLVTISSYADYDHKLGFVASRFWEWSCKAPSDGLEISGSFGQFPQQAWATTDCGPNGYVIGVEGSACGFGAAAREMGQVRVMCGTVSFAKPSPIQFTVVYSSALE